MVAQRPVPEPARYVTLKPTGSRYAYVNDTQAGKTVKRYEIFRRYGGREGWTCASENAASLNAIAAQQAEGGARGGLERGGFRGGHDTGPTAASRAGAHAGIWHPPQRQAHLGW